LPAAAIHAAFQRIGRGPVAFRGLNRRGCRACDAPAIAVAKFQGALFAKPRNKIPEQE
jgi:hypothetical protein